MERLLEQVRSLLDHRQHVDPQEEDELEFSVCLPSPALEPSALLTGGVTEPVVFLLGPEGQLPVCVSLASSCVCLS